MNAIVCFMRFEPGKAFLPRSGKAHSVLADSPVGDDGHRGAVAKELQFAGSHTVSRLQGLMSTTVRPSRRSLADPSGAYRPVSQAGLVISFRWACPFFRPTTDRAARGRSDRCSGTTTR